MSNDEVEALEVERLTGFAFRQPQPEFRRIQRQRTNGWRMPKGSIYVGRPSPWSNPFRTQTAIEWGFAVSVPEARKVAVAAFRSWLRGSDDWWMGGGCRETRARLRQRLGELRGHDLVCWCPLDQPCHADVLLEYLLASEGTDR